MAGADYGETSKVIWVLADKLSSSAISALLSVVRGEYHDWSQ